MRSFIYNHFGPHAMRMRIKAKKNRVAILFIGLVVCHGPIFIAEFHYCGFKFELIS